MAKASKKTRNKTTNDITSPDYWLSKPISELGGVAYTFRVWFENGVRDAHDGTSPYRRKPKGQNHCFLNAYWLGFDRTTKLMKEAKKND